MTCVDVSNCQCHVQCPPLKESDLQKKLETTERILRVRTRTVAKQIEEIDQLEDDVSKLMSVLQEVLAHKPDLPTPTLSRLKAAAKGKLG